MAEGGPGFTYRKQNGEPIVDDAALDGERLYNGTGLSVERVTDEDL